MRRQVIHFYSLCWNDARMLPFFFRHYDTLVDHFFIYDNGSTDGSLEILDEHERTTAHRFETTNGSFGITEIELSDTIWRGSIGVADWVVMTDLDEHLHHDDLRGYLARCTKNGITALDSIGYEMVSEAYPPLHVQLSACVRSGVRSLGHDKLCIFDPAAVSATNFGPGRHTARPAGHVVWPPSRELKMLHYKKLGADYVISRHRTLREGLGRHDREAGYGRHYLWDESLTRADLEELLAAARPVPGLGSDAADEIDEDDTERLIAESGLVDEDFYYQHYRDVARASLDPVRHYCVHGWREGRNPNAYFDTAWYIARQACSGNPLLHYITVGDLAGLKPSPRFDPTYYRQSHGLPDTEPALRHWLTSEAVR